MPFVLVSLCFTVCCSYPSVLLPLYVWLCVALPLCSTVSLLLLSLCYFAYHIFISELHWLILLSTCSIACLLISLCSTASAAATLVFLCLSTYISVLYCLWYSYPYVPSPLYLYLCVPLRLLFLSLSSIASLLNVSVFYCLFSSCSCVPLLLLLLSRVALSTTRLHVLHCLCYSYLCVLQRVLLISLYSIAFATCIRGGLCLPYPCTCVVLTLHALSVTHITSFIFVCVAVVIGIRFV